MYVAYRRNLAVNINQNNFLHLLEIAFKNQTNFIYSKKSPLQYVKWIICTSTYMLEYG